MSEGVECKLCGRLFKQITNTHLGYVHAIDKSRYLKEFLGAKIVSDETMLKYVGNQHSKGNVSPRRGLTYEEYYGNEKASKTKVRMRKPKSVETCLRQSRARLAGLASGNISSWNKGLTKENSDGVMRISRAKRIMWRNPQFRESQIVAIMKASHVMPNKAEMKLSYILRSIAPKIFYYNGDFRLGISIGGKVPDFVNMDGKKQVIELFGDYWHQGQGIDKLARHYAGYHYGCLVIWEHEIYEGRERLRRKILEFIGGK